MSTAHDVVDRAWRQAWEVEQELTPSEWADRNRILTARSSHETGPWRTSRVPFAREIMDNFAATSTVRRTVCMFGRQLAKSSIIENVVGFVMDLSPAPILIVEPNLTLVKRAEQTRIAPMIAESTSLTSKVSKKKSRDSSNTMFMKLFNDGVLYMANAGSSAAMRGISALYVLLDEVGEYEQDVDRQGDAVAIAEDCAANFPTKKIGIFGNPGVRGKSVAEREYLRGDQRRYFIPCPRCGYMDVLTWNGRDWFDARAGTHHRIAWDKEQLEGDVTRHLPATAHMICGSPDCQARIEEHEKEWMLEQGEWRPTPGAGDGITRSYQLSSLYSPFRPWDEIAIEFLAVKGSPETLRSWVNNKLGETFEERGDKVEVGDLMAEGRLERWEGEVPLGVGVLVAGVDVQADRLVYVVKGYGAGEESWLIEWGEVVGDTLKDRAWQELSGLTVLREFTHASGQKMMIERMTVDSGDGKHTDRVYSYCSAWNERGVFAIKGGRDIGKPLVGLASMNNRYRTPLFVLCVDTGKATIVSRLRMQSPGPGFMHLPAGIEPEYLRQLTAEKAVYRWANGSMARKWEQVYSDNHAFDAEVYALAALKMLGAPFVLSLADRAALVAQRVEGGAASGPSAPVVTRRPRAGWVNSWRR